MGNSFASLDAKAKQEMIDNSRYDLLEESWWADVYYDARQCGNRMGITLDTIYFSGFCSQGDGACFAGDYRYRKNSIMEIKKYAPSDTILHEIAIALAQIQKPTCYGLVATITPKGRYNHEHSTLIEVNDEHNQTSPSEKQEEALMHILRDFMRWIYSCLEKEHDYLTSDEAVSDYLSNDYFD